jgi:predicted Zn-dependent protease
MGTAKKNMLVEAAPRVKEMTAKIHAGDGKGAVAIYRSLPEAMRREKSIMLVYVMAASKIDDEAHGRALDELRAAFPNDRGIEMMFIDANLLRGRYDEAIRIVDKVETSVGGDPYLDVIRSNIRQKEGKLDAAEAFARRATERDENLQGAWWALVNINLAQKDHAETLRALSFLRDTLEVEIDDLAKYPEYAEFVKSKEYREFVE